MSGEQKSQKTAHGRKPQQQVWLLVVSPAWPLAGHQVLLSFHHSRFPDTYFLWSVPGMLMQVLKKLQGHLKILISKSQ